MKTISIFFGNKNKNETFKSYLFSSQILHGLSSLAKDVATVAIPRGITNNNWGTNQRQDLRKQ
jgi:hypothetical protein